MIKSESFFLLRPTQATFPRSLSAQYNFDQHSGSLVSQRDLSSLFLQLDQSRCVVCRVTQSMSPTMVAWARWVLRRQRERLVGIDKSLSLVFFSYASSLNYDSNLDTLALKMAFPGKTA